MTTLVAAITVEITVISTIWIREMQKDINRALTVKSLGSLPL